jgi:alkaline phosphatase D
MSLDVTGWNSWETGPLRAGPMLGEVGETDAFVWIQGKGPSPLTLTVTNRNGFHLSVVQQPEEANAWCITLHVTGLTAGTVYDYFISSTPPVKTPVYKLRAGLARSARRTRIAFGSCFFQCWEATKIFESIDADRPDLFIMAGDNCYFLDEAAKANQQEQRKDIPALGSGTDWQDERTMMLAHLRHRNSNSLRTLLPHVPVLGIWDDHDFGPNDSDTEWGNRHDCDPQRDNKSVSLSAFKRMWAQRTYGTTGLDGVFSTVRCGPVEVFLTDGRFDRFDYRPGDSHKDSHILGDAQLSWLKAQLLGSTAPVKLIVSGSVVLPQFVKTMESKTGRVGNAMDRKSSHSCYRTLRRTALPVCSLPAAICISAISCTARERS